MPSMILSYTEVNKVAGSGWKCHVRCWTSLRRRGDVYEATRKEHEGGIRHRQNGATHLIAELVKALHRLGGYALEVIPLFFGEGTRQPGGEGRHGVGVVWGVGEDPGEWGKEYV